MVLIISASKDTLIFGIMNYFIVIFDVLNRYYEVLWVQIKELGLYGKGAFSKRGAVVGY